MFFQAYPLLALHVYESTTISYFIFTVYSMFFQAYTLLALHAYEIETTSYFTSFIVQGICSFRLTLY